MIAILFWILLALICWPVALALLLLYPLVWLLLLPFRLLGLVVGSVLELIGAILFLPARLIRAL